MTSTKFFCLVRPYALYLLGLSLSACGGGHNAGTAYSIGGTVSGLAAGTSVTLTAGGTNTVTLSANQPFKFPSGVGANGSYQVSIASQPAGETCSVLNASGTGMMSSVNNIQVSCSVITFSLSGSVSGLSAGQTLTLSNGNDRVALTANGTFAFPTPINSGGGYSVTIASQPSNETCSVSGGTGSGVAADVSSLALTCTVNSYSIGGTLTGLASGQTVTLEDNGGSGGNVLTITTNGGFTFSAPVPYGGSYAVTVGTQPVGQFCSVNAGASSDVAAAVSGVTVSCTRAWYVSGTGVDTNDGKTIATAFRTLGRPASFVSPGDSVLVMNGTYTNDTGGAVLGLSMAGTPSAWITYRAYPGQTPLIQTDGIWGGITFGATAQYIEVNGFTVIGNNPSLTLAGAQAVETDPGNNPKYNGNCIAVLANRTTGPYPHHIRILNNTVSECPGGGIGTVGADYLTISGNTIFNNAYYSPYGDSGISTLIDYDTNPADTVTQYKIVITNNVIYGNQEFIPVLTAGLITDGEGIIIDSNHDHAYDPTVPYAAYTGRTLRAGSAS
jgi:parallel beta-helix repeat protein